ncbi:MAG: Holliday junction branch migration DNA helicase RuvB, partial [Isosphaeraceae bacterium]
MRERKIQGDAAGSGNTPPQRPSRNDDLHDPIDPGGDSLRPTRLVDMIGQRPVADRLRVALEACRKRAEPLPHILFDGPPGLG